MTRKVAILRHPLVIRLKQVLIPVLFGATPSGGRSSIPWDTVVRAIEGLAPRERARRDEIPPPPMLLAEGERLEMIPVWHNQADVIAALGRR